jgi:hypothetical protein
VSGMLTLKASVAAAILAGTALVSASAGYAISRATLTAQVAVSRPAPTVAAAPPELLHALPDGTTPALNAGKKW